MTTGSKRVVGGRTVVIVPDPHRDVRVAPGAEVATGDRPAAAATQAAALTEAARDGVPLCEDCSKPG